MFILFKCSMFIRFREINVHEDRISFISDASNFCQIDSNNKFQAQSFRSFI